MERISTYPQFFGRVHNGFLRPISGVRNDDREAIDLAVLIFIWDGCKCVPFKERPGRYLKTIKGLHRAVFEMEPDSMVGEDFRINGASTKTRPGEQRATGRNAEKPEVGRSDGV